MKAYSEERVLKLLKEQREICYQSAKIVEIDYNNPYSDADGRTKIIDKESIVNAETPKM